MERTDPVENSAVLLQQGRVLPVMEEFYSLQGEGFHTGRPAWFIRIGGCDVGCRWCDVKESWDASVFPPVPVEEVAQRALQCPSGSVVVTGGEPLLYNLDLLCSLLKEGGARTFLETSGSVRLTGAWDWICLSPKKEAVPMRENFLAANELKVIVGQPDDLEWAEANARQVRKECILLLQPEWSHARELMPVIVAYIKSHPQWRISLQSHKYMRIP